MFAVLGLPSDDGASVATLALYNHVRARETHAPTQK